MPQTKNSQTIILSDDEAMMIDRSKMVRLTKEMPDGTVCDVTLFNITVIDAGTEKEQIIYTTHVKVCHRDSKREDPPKISKG
jgi:hypothetical protein